MSTKSTKKRTSKTQRAIYVNVLEKNCILVTGKITPAMDPAVIEKGISEEYTERENQEELLELNVNTNEESSEVYVEEEAKNAVTGKLPMTRINPRYFSSVRWRMLVFSLVSAMAMFMQVRKMKVYPKRRRIDNCKQLLRFGNDSIDFLASQFLPENIETRGGALSSRQKMEILLRYFGDPGFQSGVAEDMGVHRSTVTKTVNYVMDCIIARADEWIHFPATPMPTVIGALDCTHVEINKPTLHGDEYINRKGYATINVQATCNAAEQFTSISAEWPGSVHDARIWRTSPIRGYGISPWLITPFQPPRNGLERHFNLIQARERCIIERLFGQLKKRFPILGNCVRVTSERVPKVIISCAVLHNVAKHLNDVFDLNNEENEQEAVEGAIVDEQQETRATKARGIQKRNEMM
ncbi:hypothetical protein NQ314_002696 [Rhamnusium bicolor]|uniref:DDE Tnp4 domain-containing protein n=1 Tax=Rhamnusium bicolor TaxID=1586634 RepID=A0AAV8ZPE8_9CUCU|nr:hypothetical protein NQ314_002696 [Rhamnusium bicolor]